MMVVSFNSYTIGATIGAGTVALPGAPELSPVLIGVRVAQYFVVCVCFFFFTIVCHFVLFRLDIVLFVLLLNYVFRLSLWYLQIFLAIYN